MPKVRRIKSTFTLRQKRDIMYVLLERRRQVKIREKRLVNMKDLILAIYELPTYKPWWTRLWQTVNTLI